MNVAGFQKVWTKEHKCVGRKENGDSLPVLLVITAGGNQVSVGEIFCPICGQ